MAENNLKGCNFDSITAKATHGKDIVALVADKTATTPLAIAGQQDLTFNMEVETSESKTKDGEGGWTVKFPGVKSWSATVGGLWPLGDAGRNAVVKSIIDGEPLCLVIASREKTSTGVKYTPIREGLAIATSDEIEAGTDDAATYSVSFEGTGPCWCVETADQAEVTSMEITISDAAAGSEG